MAILSKKDRMGKSAQMHLPLEMIFSLLIIAVFLVVAFFVIHNFLEVKRCADIGLFTRQLQESVDEVWQAQEASTSFTRELPSGIKYACFADVQKSMNIADANFSDKDKISGIYDNLAAYFKYRNVNFFLYPWQNACSLGANSIKHISMPETNPLCFSAAKDGKIRINLVKGFNDALVRISI
ncbi:MAG: hypothetical protein V1886_03120 [archaeon]